MAERTYTHYKFPLSRTQPIPMGSQYQEYFLNRGKVPEERGPFPSNYIEISLGAYTHNLNEIQTFTKKEGPDIIPIGKYAYMGTGGPLISEQLINAGASKIGFASSQELRFTHKEFPKIPGLMMYPLQTYDDLSHAIEHKAELTVQTLDELRLAQKAARDLGLIAQIHVQAETGFHHYGGSAEELLLLFKYANENSEAIRIIGVSSHFATAGDNNVNARRQFEKFIEILRYLHDNGHSVSSVHIANSAAITELPETWSRQTYAGVMPGAIPGIRPGGLIYGRYGDAQKILKTQEVATAVVSHISGAQQLAMGQSVGYCEQFTANSEVPIAIIPVGWGSGNLVENTVQRVTDGDYTEVLIHGIRSPIIGLVGASSFAVINYGKGKKGEAVLLVGKEGNEQITFDEIALKNGMISTQFTTMLGNSLPQVYYEGQ